MSNRISLIILLCAAIFFVGCQGTPQNNFKELAFEAQYIRTDGYHDGVNYPVVTLINSTDEMNEYYSNNKDSYNLERQQTANSDSTIGFLDAADKYSNDFFSDNVLVLVLLEEPSGSNRHAVTGVKSSEKKVEIGIKRTIPEIGTSDMAQWHIIVELKRDNFNKDAEILVTLE